MGFLHFYPDAEAETPVLWPPYAERWLFWKDPDAGKDWGQEEKGTTEDEMAGWHHQHNGHGFGWTLGVGDGQGGLACCGSWGCKELDTTERLNWTVHCGTMSTRTCECFPQNPALNYLGSFSVSHFLISVSVCKLFSLIENKIWGIFILFFIKKIFFLEYSWFTKLC